MANTTMSGNFTPVNTPDVNDGEKMLDIFHNGIKIGVVPDTVPDEFDTDDECRAFLKELKELPKLSVKHSKTLDNCLTIMGKVSDDNGEDKLDDVDQFGFDLGDSFSDDEYDDDDHSDDDHSDDEDIKHSI